MKVRPPGVEETWDECSSWVKTLLLAYDDIRGYEDAKMAGASFKI